MACNTNLDGLSVVRWSGHEFTASSDFDLWSVWLPKYVCSCEHVYSTLVSGSETIMRSIDRVDRML